MTLTNVTAPGVAVRHTTFKQIADGVVDARVWGGIHWRTSSVRGRKVGEQVGRYAAHQFLTESSPFAHDNSPRERYLSSVCSSLAPGQHQ
jgi:hypothetical protein